jgi:hypothetical protein
MFALIAGAAYQLPFTQAAAGLRTWPQDVGIVIQHCKHSASQPLGRLHIYQLTLKAASRIPCLLGLL